MSTNERQLHAKALNVFDQLYSFLTYYFGPSIYNSNLYEIKKGKSSYLDFFKEYA